MAISLKDYLSGGFKVPNDLASMKELTNLILNSEAVFGAVGNNAPLSWAKTAQDALKSIDEINSGQRSQFDNHGTDQLKKYQDLAFSWLTGAKQPSGSANFKAKYAKSVDETQKKLANIASNIANVGDIPANASAKERAAYAKKIASMQDQMKALAPVAEQMGIDVSKSTGLVKTASGYIPQSQVAKQAQPTTVQAATTAPAVTATSSPASPTAVPTTDAASRAQAQEAAAYAAVGKNPDGTPMNPTTATPSPTAPVAATPPTNVGGRVLSSTEKQNLDAAYARIQAGTPGAQDQANVDYAKKNGLWNPASTATTAVPPTTASTATQTAPQAPVAGSATTAPGSVNTPSQAAPVGFDPNSVQWKPNISQEQKDQFVKLFASKSPENFSDADKANWAYATNGAPLPQAGAGGVVGAPPPTDMNANLKALGLSDETIAKLPVDQQALFASIGAIMQKQIDNGNPLPQTFTTDDLHRFADQAAKDPTIDKFYKDQLRLGVADLNAKLGFLQGDTQAQFEQLNRAFPEQNTAASHAAAAAGQAYSGFRNKAKEQLKANQQTILQSTTRQAQQNLRNLGQTFETTYGSQNLPQGGLGMPTGSQGGLSNIGYTPFGNVPGQLEQNKQLDIANKNQSLIQDARLIRGF